MKLIQKLILIPLFTFLYSDVYDGYLLYSPNQGGQNSGNNNYTRLIDNDGDTVHEWNHVRGVASMPYLRQDSILVYPYRVQNPTMDTGGVGGGVQYVAWDGEILWDYELSNETYQHHHDVEPLPNGNVLMVAWERKYAADASAMGRESVNNSLNQMWSEAILEIEPYTGNIVWEWHLWDHLVQDVGSGYGATYGTISDHPELLDINYGNVGGNGGPGGPNADWKHVNAIAYNEDLDQIAISSRHGNEIYIIDHSTTTAEAASHSGGNSGKGGDILYRWGNPAAYDRNDTNAWDDLSGQHGVNWIPEGYPGAGDLLIFNNGHSNSQSAAYQITPPIDANGNYYIENGEPFGPQNTTWQQSSASFKTNVQGGAFRLPNGNTIITEADDAHIFEIDENGTILWQFNPNVDMIARATKYPLDYLEQSTPGDINDDGTINILDVVLVVNIILGTNGFNSSADLNNDGIANVLDIVLLVNIILGN